MDGLRARAEEAAEAVLGEVVAAEAERVAGEAVQEARRERDRKVRSMCGEEICMQRDKWIFRKSCDCFPTTTAKFSPLDMLNLSISIKTSSVERRLF